MAKLDGFFRFLLDNRGLSHTTAALYRNNVAGICRLIGANEHTERINDVDAVVAAIDSGAASAAGNRRVAWRAFAEYVESLGASAASLPAAARGPQPRGAKLDGYGTAMRMWPDVQRGAQEAGMSVIGLTWKWVVPEPPGRVWFGGTGIKEQRYVGAAATLEDWAASLWGSRPLPGDAPCDPAAFLAWVADARKPG